VKFYNEDNDLSNFSSSFLSNPRNRFGSFAKGYFLAASRLASHLLSSQSSFPDYEAYPVVFLYRHSLELYLKDILYKGNRLSEIADIDDTNSELYNNHKLSPLAEKASLVLQKKFPIDDDLRLFEKRLIQIASEFQEIDPESFSYRYPIDRKGEHSTSKSQTVNLSAFSTNMNSLLEKMESIDFGFDVETEYALEKCAPELGQALQEQYK
jgi:hypothetical protein